MGHAEVPPKEERKSDVGTTVWRCVSPATAQPAAGTKPPTLRLARSHSPRDQSDSPKWLSFVAQVLLVAVIAVSDDLIRGNFSPANAREALRHAQQVIEFESGHGFFVEPGLQTVFLPGYHILFLQIPTTLSISLLNSLYAFCHVFVTLLIALWVFRRHRAHFPLLRNVMLLTTILALALYELYPLAPPRLSSGLILDQHAVLFHDTVRHFLGVGRLNFASIGYNPYAAMPSLHVAWAIIVGVTAFLLTRRPFLRLVWLAYPPVITIDVVATGNHYLLDAAGAAVVVGVATLLALFFAWSRRFLPAERRENMYSRGPGKVVTH